VNGLEMTHARAGYCVISNIVLDLIGNVRNFTACGVALPIPMLRVKVYTKVPPGEGFR